MFAAMEAMAIDALGGQQCADALVAEVARERASAARRLLLVGQWAVLNDGDSIPARHDAAGRLLPGTEQARAYGGDGTPDVAEFAVHELALLLGVPERVAAGQVGDVVDLVHRHPVLWARVGETAAADAPGADPARAVGMVQAWQATYVARRCRNAGLSLEAARWVDARTTKDLGRQAWSRFTETLEARIKAADPVLAERRRREKEATRRVTVSRTNDEGMKSLTVLLPAAQIIVMRARIHQLALILHATSTPTSAATGAGPGSREGLRQLEADAAFLLCTNPLQALQHLITAAGKHADGQAKDSPGAGPNGQAGAPTPDQSDPEQSAPGDGAGQNTAGGVGEVGSVGGQDAGPEHAGAQTAGARAAHPQITDAAPAAGQLAGRDLDDPKRLFDDRPVRGWEGGPRPDDAWIPPARAGSLGDGSAPGDPAADPPDGLPRQHPPDLPAGPGEVPRGALRGALRGPGAPAGPEPPPEPGLEMVPEAAVHPSQRDDACPTCGHDSTRPAVDSAPIRPGPGDLAALENLGLGAGKLRPAAVLYLHATLNEFRAGTGVVRFENEGVAFSHAEAVALLGHCQVKITRVVDLDDHQPVDAYEPGDRLAEQARLVHPTTVFPFSGTSSRATGVDLDHLDPYVPPDQGGKPGQTRLDNLAPLGRASHRVKTHGRGWSTRSPLFGIYLWRTPHGYCFRRDPAGTTPLGKMTATEYTQYTHDLAQEIAWDQLDDDELGNTCTA